LSFVGNSGTQSYPVVDGSGFWSALDSSQRDEIRAAMRVRRIQRGETLIERNSPAEALYVVDYGLFEVRDAENRAVAEIGAEQLMAKSGFLRTTFETPQLSLRETRRFLKLIAQHSMP
jgi:signal-transduction protein with cAMP-binding, CBS, and nucleotidyltransferase domain